AIYALRSVGPVNAVDALRPFGAVGANRPIIAIVARSYILSPRYVEVDNGIIGGTGSASAHAAARNAGTARRLWIGFEIGVFLHVFFRLTLAGRIERVDRE